MSLHSEKSESDSGVSKEERVLSLSSSCSRWAASLLLWRAEEEKVWSGMSAGLLLYEWEGILKVGGWLEQPNSKSRWAEADARHRTKGKEQMVKAVRTVTLGNKRVWWGQGATAS